MKVTDYQVQYPRIHHLLRCPLDARGRNILAETGLGEGWIAVAMAHANCFRWGDVASEKDDSDVTLPLTFRRLRFGGDEM